MISFDITLEDFLIRDNYSGKTRDHLDTLIMAAQRGGTDEKYELALELLNLSKTIYLAGVPSQSRTEEQAMELLQEVAKDGCSADSADSMNLVGYLYACGKGAPQDLYKALWWTTKAFQNGCERAGSNVELVRKEIAKMEKLYDFPQHLNHQL